MKYINGIKELINKYEVFILDQWGVMHNGYEGYVHAIDCVKYLKDNGKKLLIISNSSKRKQSSIDKLPDLGFDATYFDEVITSGEMIWNTLNGNLDRYGKNLNKCFHIFDDTKEDGLKFRDGLNNLEFVNDIKKSNFILACTPFINTKPLDYIPILNEAYDKNLLMFCANPDYETVEKNKKNVFCMGTIADLYKKIGGKVIIQGKPSNDIYIQVSKSFNLIDKSKFVAIGDSLFHDIAGAKEFNIDSILITSGIHSNSFSSSKPIWESDKNQLLDYNIIPTYLCKDFSI